MCFNIFKCVLVWMKFHSKWHLISSFEHAVKKANMVYENMALMKISRAAGLLVAFDLVPWCISN